VEREREIETFKAQEYWSVAARMEHDGTPFVARLVKFDGAKLDRLSLGDEGGAMAAKAAVEAANFRVEDVDVRPARAQSSPPFTTSTLQQEAARKLGFRPATPCAWRRRSMKPAPSPICGPTACRWTRAPLMPRGGRFPTATTGIPARKAAHL
jgi:hypothetical protein